jgi:hypothetical protein
MIAIGGTVKAVSKEKFVKSKCGKPTRMKTQGRWRQDV